VARVIPVAPVNHAARGIGVDGVLVADKPRGPTSHDVVAQARRQYGTRAVGHAGTLDPMATGVLVLLFGEATKLSGYLAAATKRYRATVRFGQATDTLDAAGHVTETRDLPPGWLDPAALSAAIDAERDRTQQRPPQVSALHVDGERAHARTRRGETVILPLREVSVSRLSLVEVEANLVTADLIVSKGYYVRAFARDLGQALGVPAHLAELRRISSGVFGLDEATAWPPPEAVPLLPTARAAERALDCAELTAEGSRRAGHGQALSAADFVVDPAAPHAHAESSALPVAYLDPSRSLVALGRQEGPDRYVVIRGFRT
jgi:tRNA pseudouridine55 synthase